MSLLMDALKKAELAKRQGQGQGEDAPAAAPTPAELTLEPLGGGSPGTPVAADTTPANLPNLPDHLEALDAQFLADAKQAASSRRKPARAPAREPAAPAPAEATPSASARAAAAPRRAGEERAAPQQAAAQNLFAAKQPPPAASRKSFAVTVGVLTLLAVIGIGAYFWWQMQPRAAFVAARPATPATPAPAAAAVAAAPATTPAPVTAAQPAPAALPGQAPHSAAAPAEDRPPPPPVRTAAAEPTRRPAPAAAAEPEGPVRITRAPLKVNPALLRGYEAFQRGDLDLALSEYEKARKSDPRNADALHGLAAVAIRQGRADDAESLYRQILDADPQDSVALAALISSARSRVDPGAAESKLKSISAAQPDLAAPHFALANLYAAQGRWSDAQQAYFRAYGADPENPDILYNLAISLEHLRQNKLAAQYYTLAIAAARTRPAGFDPAQAAARLATLQP